MTDSLKKQDEIQNLLVRLLENDLNDEQRERLLAWSRNTPEAFQVYCDFMKDYAIISRQVMGQDQNEKNSQYNRVFQTVSQEPGLACDESLQLTMALEVLAEYERTAPETIIPKVEPPRELIQKVVYPKTPPRQVNKFSLYTLAVSSAAMFFFAVWVWMTPIKPLVATLTSDVNAKWLDEDSVLDEDGDIRTGKLMLAKGMAQIDFYGGAQIILQSPAEVEFISQDKIYISSGQLVASVGRDAIGFIVDTPNAKTLDLGTEFGVKVFRNGYTAVHVFQGEVAIYPGNSEDKIVIEQGKARQVNDNGNIKDMPAKESTFVRADEFDANLKANQGSAYHRWLSYNYQLDHDPYMVAHYTFEQDPGQPDALLNQAPAAVNKLNGILGGTSYNKPDWIQGRWPQKSALEFDRDRNQRVTIATDQALSISGPITIAAWVQFPDKQSVGGHLVSCRDKFKVNYQLAYHRSQDADSRAESYLQFSRYRSTVAGKKLSSSKQFIKSGQWCLVAMTHDNHTVRFYINGLLASSEEYKFKAESVDAELVIGDVNVSGYAQRRFGGTIGELAILKRVLTDAEIAEMYQAGKPK